MATPATPGRSYEFGPFRLDPANRVLLHGEEVVPLPPKVVETLLVLVAHRGHPVGKDELIRAVWPDAFVEESNLTHNISVLRKTLGEAAIETIPKRGYRLVMPVREIRASPAEEETRGKLSVLPPPAARRWSHPLVIVLAGVSVLAGLGALGHLLLRSGKPAPLSATFAQLTDQPGQELYPSLCPDGNSFVYASRVSGNWDIHYQRVGGKAAINLTKDCPFDDTQPAFSPDGQRIAFRSERDGGGIFVMGATGESVKRVTDFGYHPAWSPDGNQIVCGTQSFERPDSRRIINSQLFLVNVSTGAKRLLTATVEDASQPNWSPHGHRIACWGVTHGQRDIWTIASHGSPKPVPVTSDIHVDWNPVWAPDGKFLYYASDRGGAMNLWRVRVDGVSGKVLGVPEPVTTPSPYSAYISFSRDGQRMAYLQQVATANLQTIRFDPVRETVVGKPAPVTHGLREAVRPDLSPDGRWLAFNSFGKQEDIYVMRTDGSGLRQLTDDHHKDRGPSWSPDGEHLVFQSDRSGRWGLWIMKADGSGLRLLTFSTVRNITKGVWAPDGRRLVSSADYGSAPFLLQIEKSAEQRFRAGPQQAFLDAADGPFVPVSWSPDGQKLAGFRVRPDGFYAGIAVYSLALRKLDRLTDVGYAPRWLSDGRRLLFNHLGQILLLDTGSRKVREVLSLAPDEVDSYFALSRDDRLIVFARRVAEADVWLMSLR